MAPDENVFVPSSAVSSSRRLRSSWHPSSSRRRPPHGVGLASSPAGSTITLPIRGAIDGFTTTELGLIGTGWAVGFVLGCLRRAQDRAPGRPCALLRVMASIASVAILANLLFISPWAWIVLRGFSGFCRRRRDDRREPAERAATRETAAPSSRSTRCINSRGLHRRAALLATAPAEGFLFFILGAIFYSLAILPSALSTAQTPRPLKTTKLTCGASSSIRPARRSAASSSAWSTWLRHAWRRVRPEDRPPTQAIAPS